MDKLRKEKKKNNGDKQLIKNYDNCEYKLLEDFPNYKFYEDGSIETTTGYRTFGFTAPNNYKIITINKKSYGVHRLICFAFNPIEGLNNLNDYNNLQVNHKNIKKDDPTIINTLNNEKDNLEWTTPSENIQHALNEGLCGYAKAILQFSVDENKNKKDFIKRYVSVAEACRETRDSKDFIKNVANKISKPNFYLWEWDIDNKNEIENINIENINDEIKIKKVKNTNKNETQIKDKKRIQIKPKKITKEQVLNYEDPEIYDY